MSQQTINVGAAPNDGTGTPLRTAFQYTNSNFSELYTALGGGSGLPGATTQVIFNDGGTNLAGDAGLVYNKTTDALTIGGNVQAASGTITGDLTVDTSTLKVDSTNNRVGIGTASPTYALSVNSGSSTTIGFFESTGSAAYLGLKNSGSTVYFGNDSTSGSFIVQTPASGFSTKLTLDNTGNLGLGVTPSYRLDVLAPGASTCNDSFNVARFTGANAVANDFSLVGPATSQVRLNFSNPASSGIGEVGYDHATNILRFVTNGTQKGAFNSTGAFVLAGGNTSANGVGIAFPATQSASTDANTLDDYEEGTWTPTIEGTSTAGTATYSTQIGRYTKVGRLVTFNLRVIYTGGTGTGNLRIAGLPFATGSVANYAIYPENISLNANSIAVASSATGVSTIGIDQVTTGGGAAAAVAYDAAGDMQISGSYIV